jgi:predicted secreted protein
MNDNLSPEMMGKLMKHGLMAETDKDAIAAAYTKYMHETEDGPTERKKVSEEYAKCMAKMAKDGLTTEESDEVGDQVNKMAKFDDEQKDMGKMAKEDLEEEEEEEEGEGAEKKKMKKMGKFQKNLISELASQNKIMADQIKSLEDERKRRESMERNKAAVAFAKQAILDGRAPQKAEADLIELAQLDMKKAERMIAQFNKGTYTVMQQYTQGGSTFGNAQAIQSLDLSGPDANQSSLANGQYLARGAKLSEMSKKIASEKKIPLSEAQIEVLKSHPNLY